MVIEEFFVTDDVPGIFNRHAKNFKENVNIFRKKNLYQNRFRII